MREAQEQALANIGATLIRILQTLDVNDPGPELTSDEMYQRYPLVNVTEEFPAALEQVRSSPQKAPKARPHSSTLSDHCRFLRDVRSAQSGGPVHRAGAVPRRVRVHGHRDCAQESCGVHVPRLPAAISHPNRVTMPVSLIIIRTLYV